MDEENKLHLVDRRRHEDYLKAIYKLTTLNKRNWVSNSEISSYLKVKPSSVTGMLYNLKERDLITWKPRKTIHLTEKGKKLAIHLSNNYDILKYFFVKILKLNDFKKIHDICCKLEHFFDSTATTALNEFVLNYK